MYEQQGSISSIRLDQISPVGVTLGDSLVVFLVCLVAAYLIMKFFVWTGR